MFEPIALDLGLMLNLAKHRIERLPAFAAALKGYATGLLET
jgi:hypothetical protein